MPFRLSLGLVAALLLAANPLMAAEEAFSFFAFKEPKELAAHLRETLPLGTDKSIVRRKLVEEGGAVGGPLPFDPATERYVYDVNLCSLYVWRWNVSATYDAQNRLQEMYVYSSNIHHPGKRYAESVKDTGGRSQIYRGTIARPEATRGEVNLIFLMKDDDGDPETLNDQFIIGARPQYADPRNLGNIMNLLDIPLWQSQFSNDKVPVHPYPDCPT